MTQETITLTGVVRGRTIECDQEPGLPDGQAVTVTLRRARPAPAPTEGLPEGLPPEDYGKWVERLVFDSSVLPGVRIVKGTRLAADAMVAELEGGSTDEAMLRAHPELTPDDLQALRMYAQMPEWIKRTAGAWAEDADELDEYLEWTRENRQRGRRGIEE